MLGRLRLVSNLDRQQGENRSYLYVKVQLPHGGEEHWLLTEHELATAQENHRHHALPEPPARLGVVALEPELPDEESDLGGDTWYVVATLYQNQICSLALQDLERIRVRVERNREDIEAHAPGWLADLLD